MEGEPGHGDRGPGGGGDDAGHGGSLQDWEALAERAVEQDVGNPGRGSEQRQTDPDEVGGGAGVGEHDHADAGQDGTGDVEQASRADDGDGELSEEFEVDG